MNSYRKKSTTNRKKDSSRIKRWSENKMYRGREPIRPNLIMSPALPPFSTQVLHTIMSP